MSDSNSSIGRLVEFCRLLMNHGLEDTNPLYMRIGMCFEISPFSHEFFDLIAAQRLTIDEARAQLHQSPIGSAAKETFHGYLQTVSDMLHTGLQNSASHYKKRITKELITGLELLDERLYSLGSKSYHPDLEARDDIFDQISIVKDALLSSGVDSRLAAWALGEVNRVEFLLRWSGHSSSHEALNILIGVIARLALAHGKAKGKEKKGSIMKALAALTVVATVVSQANDVVDDGGSLVSHMISGIKAAQSQVAHFQPKLLTDQTKAGPVDG